MVAHINYKVLNANEDFVVFLTFVVFQLHALFTLRMKSQSIAYY